MDKTVFYQPAADAPQSLLWLEPGHIRLLPLQGRQTVGRRSGDSSPEILAAAPFVSRRHGELLVQDGAALYRDVGSTNGTLLNGRLLEAMEIARLRDGDVLCFGGKVKGRGVPAVYVQGWAEDLRQEVFTPEADAAAFQVGRAVGTGLRLTERDVSRLQCIFHRTMGGWAAEDRSQTNPTCRNGRPLAGITALESGDVLRMGSAFVLFDGKAFTFITPASAAPYEDGDTSEEGAQLEIHILRRSVKKWRASVDLLKDIQLTVSCGEMVLILGGSGAGKTTFLNAVMGYEPAEGDILFGGSDVYRDYERMKYEIGYVPQEDLLRKSDTVIETLANAAEMKLPRSVSPAERAQRVQETLVTFGLERERGQLVGKLSGGQRKRLSIAVEYIGQPTLFFLDEPDSGLDGVMARSLMENLRFIADTGRIVMVITHGPDRAIDLFDKVVVLAKSGRDGSGHLAFYGSCPEALAFFETDSLEGVVRRINRPDEGGEGLADRYIEKYAQLYGGQL